MRLNLIILLLITGLITKAGNQIDSLLVLYVDTSNEISRLELLDEIVSKYSRFDTEKAIEYENHRVQIFHGQNNYPEEITALYKIGMFYYSISNYEGALKLFIRGINLSNKHKLDNLIFFGNIYIGNVYFQGNEPKKAYEYYMLALAKSIEQDDQSNISFCYNNIGNVCAVDSSFGNPEEYYLKALKIKEKLPEKASYIKSLGNMCIIYMKDEKY
ncbi:MAG: hypothetical protein DRJ05_02190 [Bacteroidetes bacterium]|nr:MAG: hypothetical protein DRJ05_02190 [Bacteroidota bacterium]